MGAQPLGADAAREWTLIASAREYLDKRFFHSPESLLVHTLAARAIAGALVKEGLTRTELEALTLEGDEHATTKLDSYWRARLTGVKEIASESRLAREWSHVGSFERVSLPAGSRLQMEDGLAGRTGTAKVSYPFSAGLHLTSSRNPVCS
jgi:hypothetical protein